MPHRQAARFSNAVLAAVLALLILQVDIPTHSGLSWFWAQRQDYIAWAASALWVAAAWVLLKSGGERVERLPRPVVLLEVLFLLMAATLPHTSLLIARRFSRRVMQAAFGVPMLGMSLTGWLMAFIMGRQEGSSSMRAIRRLVGLMSAILCAGLILGIMVYPPSVVWSSFAASFTGLIGWCLQKGKE